MTTLTCMWLDAKAGNEPAKIQFCMRTMKVRYWSTRTYHHTASPPWSFSWDPAAKTFNIPFFRYRTLREEEWAHNITGHWHEFYFRLHEPYGRILVIPLFSINVSVGPDLSYMPPPLPPAPPPPIPALHPGRSEPYRHDVPSPMLLGRGTDGDRPVHSTQYADDDYL